MRYIIICTLLFLPLFAHAQSIDGIAAIVNDDIVLNSELDAAYYQVVQQLKQQGTALPPPDQLRKQVLERLLVQRLQVARAKASGIQVEDGAVNDTLTRIAQQNGMNLQQFRSALAAEGIDYLQLRQQIREEMLVSRLKQSMAESRVSVSPQDIDRFLESADAQGVSNTAYRLAHILVSIDSDAGADARQQARAKAEAILNKIRQGADFAQIAVTESDGQQALEGGDLGWRAAGGLPSLFSRIVPEMNIGDVSNLIAADNGFHIIKLTDKRSDDQVATITESHARHILLSPNEIRDEIGTERQAQNIYQQLKAGADFAELAREHSDDPGSANQGGDLGWTPPGVFVPEFERQLSELSPGEMSMPFKTAYGWHIVQLLNRRQKDGGDLARRARAREAIFSRKAAEEYELWLIQLRDEAFIEYRL